MWSIPVPLRKRFGDEDWLEARANEGGLAAGGAGAGASGASGVAVAGASGAGVAVDGIGAGMSHPI